MLGAVWFRYWVLARRSWIDTTTMVLRPLLLAVLFGVFATSVSALGNDRGAAAFVVVSVVVVNFWSNAIIGAAYETRRDVGDGRLDVVCQSPAGILGYVFAQAMIQSVVAAIQSALIMGVFWWLLPPPWWGWGLLWGLALVVFTVGCAACGAALAVVHNSLLVTSFAVGVLVAFGSAFYPLDLLPTWVQWVSCANPVTYYFDGTRSALLGACGMWGCGGVPVWLGAVLVGSALAPPVVTWLLLRHSLDTATIKPTT